MVLLPALPRTAALGRAAAVLALGSAAVHLTLLDAGSLGSLAMTAMALVCLPCAWHLWRDPRPGVWGITAGVDAGMLAVHGQMAAGAGTSMPGMASGPGVLGWTALALVTTQLVVAGTATLRALLDRTACGDGNDSFTGHAARSPGRKTSA